MLLRRIGHRMASTRVPASEISCLFAGGAIDRAGTLPGSVKRAADAAYVDAALNSPSCRFLLFHSTRPLIASCGNVTVDPHVNTATLPRLTFEQVERLGMSRARLAAFHGGVASKDALPNIVLGTEGDACSPVIAVEYSSIEATADAAAARVRDASSDLRCGGALCASRSTCGATGATLAFTDARSLLFGATLTGHTAPLRATDAALRMTLHPNALAWPLPFHDVALLGLGKSLLTWQSRARFCGCCGGETVARSGGVKMRCVTCGDTTYPRTDPIVISLVQSSDGSRILLGRSPGFPPGFYSCLAGYMESGESVEEAVRREVWEETRVAVGRVRYLASQPWPLGRGTFSQVMIACLAVAEDDARDTIDIGEDELSDAQWVPREQVEKCMRWYYRDPAEVASGGGSSGQRSTSPRPPRAAASEPVAAATASRDAGIGLKSVPGPFAVAHQLMQAWLQGEAADMLSADSTAPKL